MGLSISVGLAIAKIKKQKIKFVVIGDAEAMKGLFGSQLCQ